MRGNWRTPDRFGRKGRHALLPLGSHYCRGVGIKRVHIHQIGFLSTGSIIRDCEHAPGDQPDTYSNVPTTENSLEIRGHRIPFQARNAVLAVADTGLKKGGGALL